MTIRLSLLLGISAALLISCGGKEAATTAPNSKQTANHTTKVGDTPSGDNHGEWLLHGLSGGEQRYSPLNKINQTNVDQLGLAFEFNDFVTRGRVNRGVEATALMEDGVLYFTGPWSVVYAVDAKTGAQIWRHDPQVDGAWARVTCCDVVNRGAALHGDLIYSATIDGYLIALNKFTGEQVWRQDTLNQRPAAYSITGAPRIAGDVIVIGNGGAEMGVRGYVTAYDLKTGQQAWRFYTVPSAADDETVDVTKARETWAHDMEWEYGGGGTVWDSMVYEAATNTLFIGVGNGSPWPAWQRGSRRADNLYLSSIVALDADTGLAKWHYQTTPGDSWDYTATQHMILADIEWQGKERQVIMQAPKNGFFYVLDRISGELLSAKPYSTVTWADYVDLKTGKPVLSDNSDYSDGAKIITPSMGGAHNWHPMAYSPDTDLVYIPVTEMAAKFRDDYDGKGYLPGSRNTRVTATVPLPGQPGNEELLEGLPPLRIGTNVVAWSPQQQKVVWKSDTTFLPAGLLTTAGNLLISGTSTGHINFFDATSGELLHQIFTGTAIMAAPMTYEIEGEQYLAVLAGNGGVFLFNYLPGIAPTQYQNSERLLVYKLGGGETPIPPAFEPEPKHPIPEGLPTDEATIAEGNALYHRHCARCHSSGGAPNALPNLWNMHPGTDLAFDAIVLDGGLASAGMAGFSDVLDKDDTLAIRAYLAADRRRIASGAGKATEMNLH